MIRVRKFTCENLKTGCVTDKEHPAFSFSIESDRIGASIKEAKLQIGDWEKHTKEQIAVHYDGTKLLPFTRYEAKLTVWDDAGYEAKSVISFETGRMGTPWQAGWITDGEYHFTEKKVSPVPMVFRKRISCTKEIKSARIYATAMGIYEIALNRKKVGEDYFAPGFTSYQSRLMYQTYDVTKSLKEENTLTATVAGGWAVGSFVFTRKNRITADRQALLLELRITYVDGSTEVIGTGPDWEVSMDGPVRAADWYDGECYDATVCENNMSWHPASPEFLRVHPKITASEGAMVRAHETLTPVRCTKTKEGLIYDFGQNFAGVAELFLDGKAGQKITVCHAEILNPDGTLNVKFLRTAKATLTYTCRDGKQLYSPHFTYMGFRYICVSGIEEADLTVVARAVYSDVEQKGSFACSSEKLNQLQSNITWSAKSNFMDIPTDCPQRDERMGWTGDIAVFAPTACYNFDMTRFLDKWLMDVQAEQLKTGGIPNTVPAQGYGFPATMPAMAVEFWGDACILVPWALYQAEGDKGILEKYYDMMKRYVDACRFWASLFSIGKHRYLWHTPSVLHFGDWIAPDVPKMSQWQKRSKWTATASLKHTSELLVQIAEILGKNEDAKKYKKVSDGAKEAYRGILTDGNGKLKEEFQTGYVLPLYFDIFDGQEKKKAAGYLAELVRKNDYCIGTGFPGTPYILFALADNGKKEEAYRMLMNEKCPSWLYEVKMGATTIWERWDGLSEDGTCPISNDGTDMMISYNHYASGAVGDFFYRRIAGIEPVTPGYKSFQICPVPGGGLTWAKAQLETPYGKIQSDWEITGGQFRIRAMVPAGCECTLVLPDGSRERLFSGSYERSCPILGEKGLRDEKDRRII